MTESIRSGPEIEIFSGAGNCTKQSMDNSVYLPDSQKLRSEDMSDKKDVISKLPDGILLHILSFLSTKDAIRTSILARRWKFLWTYLSDFHIEEYFLDPYGTEKQAANNLLNLVDRILQRAKYIKRFYFEVEGTLTVDTERTNSWISALLKYKIEELYLTLGVRYSFVLANNLLAPESLNILDLDLRYDYEIPCCVRFPGLKTLRFSYAAFSAEKSVQQFFSSCPVLQELILSNCKWKIKNVSLKIPMLTTLIISNDEDFSKSYDSSLICNVMIDAVNLVSFCCINYLDVELVLINITSLVEACIDVTGLIDVGRAIKLLTGICHVKSLKLSNKTLQVLSNAENLFSSLPTFHNLTHFGIVTGLFDSSSTIETLMDIIDHSPNLEVLDIDEGFDTDFIWGDEEWTLNRVPRCFKSSLKSFSISYFEKLPAYMQLLSFMLKNAISLEKIKLFCLGSLSSDAKKQAKMRKKLQRMRRGNASCTIEFLECIIPESSESSPLI